MTGQRGRSPLSSQRGVEGGAQLPRPIRIVAWNYEGCWLVVAEVQLNSIFKTKTKILNFWKKFRSAHWKQILNKRRHRRYFWHLIMRYSVKVFRPFFKNWSGFGALLFLERSSANRSRNSRGAPLRQSLQRSDKILANFWRIFEYFSRAQAQPIAPIWYSDRRSRIRSNTCKIKFM